MIKVFLVDDHRLFLSGVKAELDTSFELVGVASDVDDAIEDIRATQPDVVLVDVHMPGGGGLAVVTTVRETHPDMKFLALSVSDAAEDVIAMIRAGARGYVTKSIQPEELAAAIRRVNDGDAVFSPRLAGFVLDAFAEVVPAPMDPELDQLTPREKEVLPNRPGLQLQTSGAAIVDLDQDGRVARVCCAEEAATVIPLRTDPVGYRPADRLRPRSPRTCRVPGDGGRSLR